MYSLDKNTIYLAVDVGSKGAIAVKFPGGEIDVFSSPASPDGILYLLDNILDRYKDHLDKKVGRIEKVWGVPKWGASNFSFGRQLGWWEMAFNCSDIDYDLLAAKTWQKKVGIDSNPDKKLSSWTFAKEEYPHLLGKKFRSKNTIESNCADALCILWSLIKDKKT